MKETIIIRGKNPPEKCPVCGGINKKEYPPTWDIEVAYCYAKCNDCLSEWKMVYDYTGYIITKEGEGNG